MSLKKLVESVVGPKSRWLTLVIWVLIVGLLSFMWPQVNSEETNSSQLLPDSAMSVEAERIAEEQFPNETGVPLLVVWYRDGGLNEGDFKHVQAFYQDLKEKPLDYQSMVPDFGSMPLEVLLQVASEDGEALSTPIFYNTEASVDELQESLDLLNEKINTLVGDEAFSKELSDDGLHVRFTGPIAIQTDATALFSQADVTLLIATVVLVLFLLIILYRSIILALVPLIGVGFAYGLISPLLGYLASNGWIVVDAQAISIMTVLLFGAGTDYCLFLVSRYRDELQLEPNKYKALHLAIANSGGAIMMSALTTALGLLTLSLAQYASYNRFAVPFSVAIIIMGIAVLTLLPAILAILGRVAFFPFIPRTESMYQELEAKRGKPVRRPNYRSAFSRTAGRIVTSKPWFIIIITVIFLGVLAAFVPKIDYTYGVFESFPEDMPSREGNTIIAEHYPVGEIAPVQLLIDTDGHDVSIEELLSTLPYVEKVSEPLVGERNANIKEYSVVLSINPYSNEAIVAIPELKSQAEAVLKDAGVVQAEARVWLGGETATLYDTEQITSRDQNIIIPVVLGIMAILLVVYLRSIPAMLYLLLTVGLSFLSALGLGWLVIHYGYGAEAMQGLIPLYAFVFLVALGGDYNIFMISSIWKNRKKMPLKKAISEGVEETSSVITSAGLILAGTFAVLAVLPLQVLVQFGTVTAIGVLLDTFIVRPLLVPAITTALGRFSFWPGELWKKKDGEKEEA
ncbi:putative drug exporter of the RND superfamily [Mesobacillus persicus]|uniref:Putative drug exporter of the RND superfamily n=1 Tax=Mesobacillus persicus TaxID=930146 RepID=A0A1H8EAD4_9BACI|nr:MMPL family transporter [Mesobacillus persicus]SEN16479.1 putative drug exporter of the RND superfamily [Mesobacillus persicus]